MIVTHLSKKREWKEWKYENEMRKMLEGMRYKENSWVLVSNLNQNSNPSTGTNHKNNQKPHPNPNPNPCISTDPKLNYNPNPYPNPDRIPDPNQH